MSPKLELDINKKNDELEGFKQVIYKLQNKLEKTDDEEKSLRKLHTERSESKFNNCQSKKKASENYIQKEAKVKLIIANQNLI